MTADPIALVTAAAAAATVALGLLAARSVPARRILGDLDAARDARDEELWTARLGLARAAERDHELRNGLAGLAGATALLAEVAQRSSTRPSAGDREAAELARAVAAELTRLDDLLSAAGPTTPAGPARSYAVAPVLTGQALLHRSSGTRVDLDVAPGLHALGSPDALAQVVVNLIGNAERHAPGSPVRIRATRHGHGVRIVVSDEGPRPAVASARDTARRGPGLGLGLAVCRRVLATEDGVLVVRPPDPARPGHTVAIDLPAPPAVDPPTPPTAGRSAGCAVS